MTLDLAEHGDGVAVHGDELNDELGVEDKQKRRLLRKHRRELKEKKRAIKK